MERVKGIEPSYAAWEAAVLPLNYTRSDKINIRNPKDSVNGINGNFIYLCSEKIPFIKTP